jgi:dimethylaniline monooxygenase (N-oxide forming)
MAPLDPPRVIILGAGFYGLSAARTYLRIRPDIHLTIIDADSSVGGVWSKDRVHQGFTVDSPVPLFEYSDLSMKDVKELDLNDWDDIPSDKVYQYLEIYCKKFGLLEKTRLNTTVVDIRHPKIDLWELDVKRTGSIDHDYETVTCNKLIMAIGAYSAPRIPDLDISTYSGLAIHSKDFGKNLSEILSPKNSTVTVVGGHKSAVDCVLTCAEAGKKINWIIREDAKGAGASWMVAAKRNGKPLARFKQFRASELLSPNLFKDSFISWLLFHTRIGMWLFKKLSGLTSRKALAPYCDSENGKLLTPKIRE